MTRATRNPMSTSYDPMANPSYPDIAEQARTLQAISRHGALATLDPREGYPYTSLVELLGTEDGDILFFLSDLAAHTTNLKIDPRASVLLRDPFSHDDVLARARMTLMGELVLQPKDDALKSLWTTAHPSAANYIGFKDFNFYKLEVSRVRYIAGFGRMDWLEEASYKEADADPLTPSLEGILTHMNEDHAYNMIDYARAFAGLAWVEDARMINLDNLGFDIEVTGKTEEDGSQMERLRMMFSSPCEKSHQVRKELVALATRARELLATTDEEE